MFPAPAQFRLACRSFQAVPEQARASPCAAIGNQAEVADAMEAAWQHMHQEPAHELIGRERHGFMSRSLRVAFVPVVLQFECDTALIHRHQP